MLKMIHSPFLCQRIIVCLFSDMRLLRQLIGAGLILLFGPAPFATLFASPAEAFECRMACCKRKHDRHCSNGSSFSESGSVSIAASDQCRADCLRAQAAPGAKTLIIPEPTRFEGFTPAENDHVSASLARPAVSFADPFRLVSRRVDSKPLTPESGHSRVR